MKKGCVFFALLFLSHGLIAQEVKPVKNVIMMIPDGTSASVYSAARWFKYYNGMEYKLNVDPYLTGTVSTFSSNAPIGDSAPTGSTYATGILQQEGNVGIHPAVSDNDLFPVDSTRTYQPAANILEASKIEKNKAVGIVVTCEFSHATPADFSAHYYNRDRYKVIAPQIAYQNLDLLFAGGNGLLTDDMKNHFVKNETTLIQDDKEALLHFSANGKVWALFDEIAMPYHIDKDLDRIPSLAEMTEKALELLSKNPNGFFLMVEGSHVDWAAHANDPATMIEEFLAFDDAVGKVMAFAEKEGNTAVVIASDHGNSGFSIGSKNCSDSGKLSLEQLFGNVSKYKMSSVALESILIHSKPEKIKEIFKEYTDIDLSDEEMEMLLSSKNYKEADYTQVGTSKNLAYNIGKILNSKTCFGFTTGSHTGEEVLLASYHPQGDILKGNVTNRELNQYLQKVTGLERSLQELSDRIFAKHDQVFNGMNWSIDKGNPNFPVLKVKKGKNILEVKAFSSVATLNGKPFDLGSVTVYIDKNDTFYLPVELAEKL